MCYRSFSDPVTEFIAQQSEWDGLLINQKAFTAVFVSHWVAVASFSLLKISGRGGGEHSCIVVA